MTRSNIDGWQEYSLTASLTGLLNDSITVLGKLFAIQMAVSIYIIKN